MQQTILPPEFTIPSRGKSRDRKMITAGELQMFEIEMRKSSNSSAVQHQVKLEQKKSREKSRRDHASSFILNQTHLETALPVY